MNEKRSSRWLVVAGVIAAAVLVVYFGGGALWRMLLTMHGHHG